MNQSRMAKFYLVYGFVVCLAFAYATQTGLSVTDSYATGKWTPAGHGVYHK